MWYKKAFDKSFLENKRPTGKGAYGKYYSDFTQEELKKLKRQLGNYTPHMGIKQFHVSSLFEDIIQENLALIYFSPIINEFTDMRAPRIENISLSSIISNKIAITQHMPGVSLYDTNYNSDKYQLSKEINKQIIQKLHKIGILWQDNHAGNYFVDKNLLTAFLADLKEARIKNKDINVIEFYRHTKIDLSEGASILDFGMMFARRNSRAAHPLIDLKDKITHALTEKPNNELLKNLLMVTTNMIIA